MVLKNILMIRKYLLPFLALVGAIIGLLIVIKTQKTVAAPPILFKPASSPYEHAIAGSGIVETFLDNIAIGTPFNEIVDKVFVEEGKMVKVGDPLFQLDIRNFEAQATAAEASLKSAIVAFEDKKKQFSFYQRLKDTRAVSEQNYEAAEYAYLEAEENVKIAKANLEIAKVNIERSTILAPIEGLILQVNIHPGEIATITTFFSSLSPSRSISNGSLILMGRVNRLQIRVDIDEEDAWRYQKGAAATAFVRGNSEINFPIQFLSLEPYVVPKRSLTGATTERVDTRVLQVLYEFERHNLPVYVGQILDIFIESEPYNTVQKNGSL